MKKRILVIILVLLMVVMTSCGEKTKEDYTYADLSDEQKKIIDNVYDKYSDWDYITDSGQDLPVTKIKFIHEDSVLVFIAFHAYPGTNGGGSSSVYEVDALTGEVRGHTYNILDERERNFKRAIGVQAYTGFDYDVNASTEEQKDILANSYLKLMEHSC